jgi:hypothetical protein
MEPYAAAALVMVGSGSEATNRIESLRLVGLAARTAAFALHCGDAAIVVKKNFVAAKLTGDDPPAAAENLKLLLSLDAETDSEAFYHSERVVYASN